MMSVSYLPHDGYFGHHVPTVPTQLSKKEAERQYNQQCQALVAQQLTQKDAEEYGDDVLAAMHEQELKCMPCVASIDVQDEIKWYMRPYLLDFLIEAHMAFGLMEDTLFLAVSILDRYCSKRVVYRKHYQLVGCTALLIASKYNECSKKVPQVKELTSMCCGLYEENMFIQMERHIMMTLEWHIGAPTVEGFLSAALAEAPSDLPVEHMALYILEISLFNREMIARRPSELASAALTLARIIFNRPSPYQSHWAARFESDTLVRMSHLLQAATPVLRAKYEKSQVSRVSVILNDFLVRHTAIARSAVPVEEPPTPPSDIGSPVDHRASSVEPPSLCTPVKGQHSSFAYGCPTPPITPDVDNFGAFARSAMVHVAPGTPTPESYDYAMQMHGSHPAICVHPPM